MSVFVLGLGLYAGWLFSRGDYASGVAAAAISLVAGILDGCDGELARLQFKESAFGCWLDTLGDYAYYLATFAGLTIGAVRRSGWPGYWVVGAALLGGAVLTIGLLVLLRHRATEGRPERLNVTARARFTSGPRWARVVARLSTCATRAMMPYGIMAFALAGLLEVVLVLAAIGAQIYWISLALKLPDLLPGSLRLPPDRGRADPAPSV
jgi:phosphatidylglycerophosphate synthase